MRNTLINPNLLCVTLYSFINVYSSSKRLLVLPHLTSVTVITTSLLEVCATVPAHDPGVREGSICFLDTSWIPSELKIEQNIFSACQYTSSECAIIQPRSMCSNTLSIDSRLNRIDPSTNIIYPPNAEQGYKSKLGIILGGVFQYSIE